MNTKCEAEKRIHEFLNSENGTMVLSGTHMFKKHKLILNILAKKCENLKILFRVNSLQNTDNRDFLGFKANTGKAYKLGKNELYIDSMNAKSWGKTPNDFDIIIFYPAGSLYKRKSAEVKNNLEDIFKIKNANKIIFVTCQEGKYSDISYLKEYDDIFHVEYDSEEDDIEYHKRVLEDKFIYNFKK
ncbi:hypothetical protein KPL47_15085 [Clostridium estertheticum]|uniref:hypothetical protein n=1 Tax=Clostridium estertheticum TaxID=238834 RepID=UPI001C0E74C0|nr:hypothetical protein [Clostridium estertheticum]MBU3177657.1 hypothetical protein [Clostridium estertheticum]